MLKPVNHTVIVKPDAPMERKGAIILPTTKMQQTHGIVIASDSALCKPGDRVHYCRMWPIDYPGHAECIVVHEKELLAVDDSPTDAGGAPSLSDTEAGRHAREVMTNPINLG